MWDAALHAVLIGFVFSMVFGHAPVILHAVLRIPGQTGRGRESCVKIGLMLIAALVLAAGVQAEAPAPRIEVSLAAAERELVLDKMRTMLAQSQPILDAALKDERPRLAESARSLGLHGGAHMAPELAPRLPTAFKQLAQQSHRAFDDIADAADKGEPGDALLARLSDNLGRCVACHASYRLGEPR